MDPLTASHETADTPARPAPAWVAGSDAPEQRELRIGYVPLADCAPLLVASALGLDRRHGLRFVLSREASWAAVRDKLVGGGLDLAQVLYGLVCGLHLGVGGPRTDMAVLMTINRNAQGLTLSLQMSLYLYSRTRVWRASFFK